MKNTVRRPTLFYMGDSVLYTYRFLEMVLSVFVEVLYYSSQFVYSYWVSLVQCHVKLCADILPTKPMPSI